MSAFEKTRAGSAWLGGVAILGTAALVLTGCAVTPSETPTETEKQSPDLGHP